MSDLATKKDLTAAARWMLFVTGLQIAIGFGVVFVVLLNRLGA